jgi:hypothetical protein
VDQILFFQQLLLPEEVMEELVRLKEQLEVLEVVLVEIIHLPVVLGLQIKVMLEVPVVH